MITDNVSYRVSGFCAKIEHVQGTLYRVGEGPVGLSFPVELLFPPSQLVTVARAEPIKIAFAGTLIDSGNTFTRLLFC